MPPTRTAVPDRLRRRVALLELLLFVGPPAICWNALFPGLTLLLVLQALGFDQQEFESWKIWLPLEAYLVVAGICLTACVFILITFIAHGREGLKRRHRGWWIAATTGVLLSCSSALTIVFHLSLPSFMRNLPMRVSVWFIFLWIGVPAVVPMLHMYFERLAGAHSRHRSGEMTG